ncbi:MAG: hypothetical protein EKK64_03620 [Neisseriaceae bacterium]|nr:MAG: hypothetical protein EKK64_03620 [Neisseriaceae bacterium]
MNNETVKKNIEYQEEVKEIAVSLFYNFYVQYYEKEFLEFLDIEDNMMKLSEGNDNFRIFKEESIFELMPKAERFLEYFKSAEKAKETIKFLNIVNHKQAKMLIEEM